MHLDHLLPLLPPPVVVIDARPHTAQWCSPLYLPPAPPPFSPPCPADLFDGDSVYLKSQRENRFCAVTTANHGGHAIVCDQVGAGLVGGGEAGAGVLELMLAGPPPSGLDL